MAVVDSLLKLIAAQGADALVIPPGEPPSLEKGGEPKQLSMPYPGDDIVAMMVEEVADEAQRQQLSGGTIVETRYTSDDDALYNVRLEPRDGKIRLVFRVPGDDSDGVTDAPVPVAVPAVSPLPIHATSEPPPRVASTQTGVATTQGLHDGAAATCEPGTLRPVIERAVADDASDILLSVGKTPRLRIGGDVLAIGNELVSTEALEAFIGPALFAHAEAELHATGSTDLAVLVHGSTSLLRYRANVFRQHQGLAVALRPIRRQPPRLRELGLPDELTGLVAHHSGLVLMTGTAGSGKSTTLVALIEYLNRSTSKHVITLEDPIEYEYQDQRALIHQRQIGTHVDSFSTGLRAALRESPDVIMVGEMRDHATIAAALTAAETGHLVLSTLHANGAPMAIDRIVDVFAEHQQHQVRQQLAGSLRAVVTQVLLPTTQPPARAPAIELMRTTTAVATKIREGRVHQLQSEIQKGRGEGMISLESSLASLVLRQQVSVKDAVDRATDPALFQQLLRAR